MSFRCSCIFAFQCFCIDSVALLLLIGFSFNPCFRFLFLKIFFYPSYFFSQLKLAAKYSFYFFFTCVSSRLFLFVVAILAWICGFLNMGLPFACFASFRRFPCFQIWLTFPREEFLILRGPRRVVASCFGQLFGHSNRPVHVPYFLDALGRLGLSLLVCGFVCFATIRCGRDTLFKLDQTQKQL